MHRIGRTARLGADGDAISFACERFVYSLPDIEEYIGESIPVEQVDESLMIEPAPPVARPKKKFKAKQRSGGRSGSRSGARKRRSAS